MLQKDRKRVEEHRNRAAGRDSGEEGNNYLSGVATRSVPVHRPDAVGDSELRPAQAPARSIARDFLQQLGVGSAAAHQ
eukprot:4314083-Prymnesium_polylepis.1